MAHQTPQPTANQPPSGEKPPSALYTLGPEGTFSDMAARKLLAHLGHPAAIHYTRSIPEVALKAHGHPEAWGVLPIENSVAGTVAPAQDSLMRHPVAILHEVVLQVRFGLLANGPLGQVATLYAHPHAFDQCSDFVAENLPGSQTVFSLSNVDSGQRYLAHGPKEPVAAIVPLDYAEKLEVEMKAGRLARRDIQDQRENITRFLAVRGRLPQERFDYSLLKTSIYVEPEADRVGLLLGLLQIFNSHGINLCRLESRPARNRPWAYGFYIDFFNTPQTPACLKALIQASASLTVLGSYPSLD